MLTDPLNLKGILFNADKDLAQRVPDLKARDRKWLEVLAGHEGVVNGWIGYLGEGNSVHWATSLLPEPVPTQFNEDSVRNILQSGKPFTFVDHIELTSGGLFPLVKQGEIVGLIGMTSDQTDFFGANNVKWMITLSKMVVSELFREDEYSPLGGVEYYISRILQSSFDIQDGLPVVLKTLTEVLSADAAIALRNNPLSGRFELLMTHGLKAATLAKLNFQLDAGRRGRKLERPIWIADLQERTHVKQTISPLQEDGFRGYLALPLNKNGVLVGALEFAWHSPQLVVTWNDGFLERICEQAAFLIDRSNVLNNYRELNAELTNRYNAMIEGLSRALELRDLETEGHTRRVSELTMRLIERLGGPVDHWDAIRQGALLHDIGKIGIPDAILLKPGSLTDRERQVMQQHVIYGYNILAPITSSRPILDITLYHHERWDGSGYPYGLKGEQIPLVARVFAFVDVFDALISDRPYRTAWSSSQALEYISGQAGHMFDPHISSLFLKVVNKDLNPSN